MRIILLNLAILPLLFLAVVIIHRFPVRSK